MFFPNDMPKKKFHLDTLRNLVPQWLKDFIRNHVSLTDYDKYLWDKEQDILGDVRDRSKTSSLCPFRLGIISEFAFRHRLYQRACMEMGIPHEIIDMSSNDWIKKIRESRCDAFLVWPSSALKIWKSMYDDRLKILTEILDKMIYPSYLETWIYESKSRVRDWLDANFIPHPKTWVFYDRNQAMEFADSTDLPIVFKADLGSCATGVKILRTRRDVRKMVHITFSRGYLAKRANPHNRQWGYILFQEYIPDVNEWRMVRIGDSFFGYKKERSGDFHSGSGLFSWETPSSKLLIFLKTVTDKGNFTSMDVDVFETKEGNLLVNELQTVFGASYPVDQLRVNGRPGRFIFDKDNNDWVFEEGDYSRNACANLRVLYVLSLLKPGLEKKFQFIFKLPSESEVR